MGKSSLIIILFLLCIQGVYGKTYKVSSQIEFERIVNNLQAGDEVIIASGNYENWSVEVKSKGTASKPIVITGQNQENTIFSGSISSCIFNISGDFIILKNLTFKNSNLSREKGKTGTLIELNGSNHSEIRNCSFLNNRVMTQFLPLVIVSGNGSYNAIRDCTFLSNINSIDLQVKITADEKPLYTQITNNLFKDKAKVTWANGNGGECVQIGQDPILLGNQAVYSNVKNNRFIRCNGENEVISNKSSGNKYINNYFENNDGELVMRGGHDCLIEGNVFKGGTGGIRINGSGHTVINNKLTGIKTAIRLMYGMAKGKTETGFYIAPSQCLIKGNKISDALVGILEGDSKNADWTGKFDTKRYPSRVMQDIAPFNNQIINNKFSNVTTHSITQ